MELRPHEIESIRLQRDIDAMIERDKRIYAERTLEPVRKIKSKPVKLKWPRRNIDYPTGSDNEQLNKLNPPMAKTP